MRASIQKWGKSLAIRIPSAMAQTAHLKDHTRVEVSLANGKIIITLARPPRPKLKSLLAKITAKNIHTEIETGDAIGNELS